MSSRPTSTERDRFFEQYHPLWSILATFHEPKGATDEELAQEYVQGCDPCLLEEILAEGQRFLEQQVLPMSLIRTTANRYLVTEAEQRQWLQTLLSQVEAALAARKSTGG